MKIYAGWPEGQVSTLTFNDMERQCIAYYKMEDDYEVDSLLVETAPANPGCPDILDGCPFCDAPRVIGVLDGSYDGCNIKLVKYMCETIFALTMSDVVLYSMTDECERLSGSSQDDVI